jgi:hypothetical protein
MQGYPRLEDDQHFNLTQVLRTLELLGYDLDRVVSNVDFDGFLGVEIFNKEALSLALQNVVDRGDKRDNLILFRVGAQTRSFVADEGENNHYVALHFYEDSDGLVVTYIDPTGEEISPQTLEIIGSILPPHRFQNSKLSLQYTKPTLVGDIYQMGGNDRDCGALLALAADMIRNKFNQEIYLDERSSRQLGLLIRGLVNGDFSLQERVREIDDILNGKFEENETNELDVRFNEWKKKFPAHDKKGFLEMIFTVALKIKEIENIDYLITDRDKKYLRDRFGFAVSSNNSSDNQSSLIEFFVYSFLSDLGVDKESIKYYIATINPEAIEAKFLQEVRKSNVRKIFHSLIDQDHFIELEKQLREISAGKFSIDTKFNPNKSPLDSVMLVFGYPFLYDYFSQMLKAGVDIDEICRRAETIYDNLVDQKSEMYQVVYDLFGDRGNLSQLVTDFFERKFNLMVERGLVPEDFARDIAGVLSQQYLAIYEELSPFVLFLDRIKKNYRERDRKIILASDIDDAELSKEAEKTFISAASRVVDKKLYERIGKLCLEMISLNELHAVEIDVDYMATSQFIFKLFKEKYGMGKLPVFTLEDDRLSDLLGFFQEAFISSSGEDLFNLMDNLDILRKEIKNSKYKSDFTVEDESLKALGRVENVANNLQKIQERIQDFAPDSQAVQDGVIFPLIVGFSQLITRSIKISNNFKRTLERQNAALEIPAEEEDSEVEIDELSQELAKYVDEISKYNKKDLAPSASPQVVSKKIIKIKDGVEFDLADCHIVTDDTKTYYAYCTDKALEKFDTVTQERFIEALKRDRMVERTFGTLGVKKLNDKICELKIAGNERILGTIYRIPEASGELINVIYFDSPLRCAHDSDTKFDSLVETLKKRNLTPCLKPDESPTSLEGKGGGAKR